MDLKKNKNRVFFLNILTSPSTVECPFEMDQMDTEFRMRLEFRIEQKFSILDGHRIIFGVTFLQNCMTLFQKRNRQTWIWT